MKCPRCQHAEPARLSLLPGMRRASGPGLRFLWSGTASRFQVLQQVRDTGGDGSANTTALRLTRVLHPEAPRREDPHLKSALEGERKQITVLLADLKGSMEILTDRDPEDARKILDPVLELMMEASLVGRHDPSPTGNLAVRGSDAHSANGRVQV